VRDAYGARAQQYIDAFDGGDRAHEVDAAFIGRHLQHLRGPVLDLGCGPGHWSAYLNGLGVPVVGVDVVPAFVDHASTAHPGPEFRLGEMTSVDLMGHSAAGVLSWFSTIHLAPQAMGAVLRGFRRLLAPGGTLVLGYFHSDDDVAAFDHAVVTA
jgi:SAM-dependent methyltransferase